MLWGCSHPERDERLRALAAELDEGCSKVQGKKTQRIP